MWDRQKILALIDDKGYFRIVSVFSFDLKMFIYRDLNGFKKNHLIVQVAFRRQKMFKRMFKFRYSIGCFLCIETSNFRFVSTKQNLVSTIFLYMCSKVKHWMKRAWGHELFFTSDLFLFVAVLIKFSVRRRATCSSGLLHYFKDSFIWWSLFSNAYALIPLNGPKRSTSSTIWHNLFHKCLCTVQCIQ